MRPHNLMLLGVTVLFACEDEGGNRCSGGASLVHGTILETTTVVPLTSDLTIIGSADYPNDTTIYGITVDGVAATSVGSGFKEWTATIPIGVLIQAAGSGSNETGSGSNGMGSAQISAIATTNCPDPSNVGEASVVVDLTPQVQVTTLTVTPAFPGGLMYVPSSVAGDAQLLVTANSQAAGVVVTLTSNIGTVTPNELALGSNGSGGVSASALFSSAVPGEAVIVATARQASTYAAVTVFGPPTISPNGAVLVPGQTIKVSVIEPGTYKSCQASPTTGIAVTSPDGSGSDNLMTGPGGVQSSAGANVSVTVAIDGMLGSAASTTLFCRDAYGQTATAVFSANPASSIVESDSDPDNFK